MNRAEFIIKTTNDAVNANVLNPREAVKILTEVAEMLNSGLPADKIEKCDSMRALWIRIGSDYGGAV